MKIMPVVVLMDICRAIEADKSAHEYATRHTVPVSPEFTKSMSEVIMRISDTGVRRWALNEVKGVDDA